MPLTGFVPDLVNLSQAACPDKNFLPMPIQRIPWEGHPFGADWHWIGQPGRYQNTNLDCFDCATYLFGYPQANQGGRGIRYLGQSQRDALPRESFGLALEDARGMEKSEERNLEIVQMQLFRLKGEGTFQKHQKNTPNTS